MPAAALTEICAPWVMLTVGSVHLGRAVGSTGWGVATAAGLGLVPQAAITWRVRRKALSDHHVTRREDRPLVIAGIAGSVAALLAAQQTRGAPDELRRMSRAALVALGVAGTATLKVKVSFHTAVLSGVVAVLARELSPRYWRLLGLVPTVAWARVRISHHTPTETALGAMIGLACGSLGTGRVSTGRVGRV
ncbi:hypothetical protein [Dietzia sp. B32]|uniref:hypothetical protein n=1 Tax=Dietzia sp. B32 TaxID=2915130 RepID=UPI0021ADDD64|nr:hypothetical protein [Dietzia sp. B32]UVE93736.1 hypothetical protein L8M95_09125 [Dietzia sp. B32]